MESKFDYKQCNCEKECSCMKDWHADRCKRQTEFNELYHEELGMCGDGNPEDVQYFIYNLIKVHKKMIDGDITPDTRYEMVKGLISKTDHSIIFEIVFGMLEKAGFLDVDNSIYRAIINEKGQRFFDLLEEEIIENSKF